MSLELAIQENTAAIRELIAALTVSSAAQVTLLAEATAPAKPAPAKKAVKAEPAPAPAPEIKAEEPVAPAPAPAAEPAIPYSNVATAVTELAKTKGRQAAVDLLTSFGVAKATELKAEQYGAVIAAAQVAMA